LMKILPEKYNLNKQTLYERLLHICHFISMLTDGNALIYYQNVSGKIN
jgi:dGTPase